MAVCAGGGGGGVGLNLLGVAFRLFGIKGVLGLLVVGGVGYFIAPDSLRMAMLGGGSSGAGSAMSSSVCEASNKNAAACDFSRVVLASTEDIWRQQFAANRLPTSQQGERR